MGEPDHTNESGLRAWLRAVGLEAPLRRVYHGLRYSRSTVTAELDGQSSRFWSVNQQIHHRLKRLNNEGDTLRTFLQAIRDGDVVWDVGAHVGMYAIFAAGRVGATGQVYAFEPEQQTFERLQRNRTLNSADNLTALRLALSDAPGHTEIFIPVDNAARVGTLIRPERASGGQQVELAVGDTLVGDGRAAAPNVLKIDVEGAEASVLRGLRNTLAQPTCRMLLVEVHPQALEQVGSSVDQVREMLESLGFDVHAESRRGHESHWAAYKHERNA